MIKKVIITILLVILLAIPLAFGAFVIWLYFPTLGFQVPYKEKQWKSIESPSIRYYMSDAVIEWCNNAHPTREEVLSSLGEDEFEFINSNDTVQYYYLGPNDIMGWEHYALFVHFNKDGTFKRVERKSID